MSKSNKSISIVDCIRHKQLFGSLPAFSSLDSWASWLTWLKAIYALPMDESEFGIYRQCTGRQEPVRVSPSKIHTIVGAWW